MSSRTGFPPPPYIPPPHIPPPPSHIPPPHRIRAGYDPTRELYLGVPIAEWDEAIAELAEFRVGYLQQVITQLTTRVTCVGEVNEARIKMFDFQDIPLGFSEEAVRARAAHGNEEVAKFVKRFTHFWDDDRPTDVVVAAVLAEWSEIKSRYARSSSWQLKQNAEIRTLLYAGLATEFPEWQVITQVDAALPLDNSAVERYVSAQNRIKGKTRANLKTPLLSNLMMTSLNGNQPCDVDWHAIIEIWNKHTSRGRYGNVWKTDNSEAARVLQDVYSMQ